MNSEQWSQREKEQNRESTRKLEELAAFLDLFSFEVSRPRIYLGNKRLKCISKTKASVSEELDAKVGRKGVEK